VTDVLRDMAAHCHAAGPWKVPDLLRDTIAHCHAPGAGRWPPDVPFVTAVDPDVLAGAMLAQAVYLPPAEMMRCIKDFDKRILKIDDPELDRAGESQFAFFCRMKGDKPVTWTVARGTSMSTWDDLFIDLFYLMLGRPWANPDFKKLLQFHDSCCENTDAMSSIDNFRRIAVGHSKAGAEVAELAMVRSEVEVHAFNDGGALNLNLPDFSPWRRIKAPTSNVTCHRIRGDLVCALRLPVGTTRYYAKALGLVGPHAISNFLIQDDAHMPEPVTENLQGWCRWCGLGILIAKTRDLRDETDSVLHPTQHAILALSTWLVSAPSEGVTRASLLSLWALCRSTCTVGAAWLQGCGVAVLAAAEVSRSDLAASEAVSLCTLEALAAYFFAQDARCFGLLAQVSRACLAEYFAKGNRVRDLLKLDRDQMLKACSKRALARRLAPHTGQQLGSALVCQAAVVCWPLPLCWGSSPCARLTRRWVTRELAAATGAELGAKAAALRPELFMGLYCLPIGIAAWSLAMRLLRPGGGACCTVAG